MTIQPVSIHGYGWAGHRRMEFAWWNGHLRAQGFRAHPPNLWTLTRGRMRIECTQPYRLAGGHCRIGVRVFENLPGPEWRVVDEREFRWGPAERSTAAAGLDAAVRDMRTAYGGDGGGEARDAEADADAGTTSGTASSVGESGEGS